MWRDGVALMASSEESVTWPNLEEPYLFHGVLIRVTQAYLQRGPDGHQTESPQWPAVVASAFPGSVAKYDLLLELPG